MQAAINHIQIRRELFKLLLISADLRNYRVRPSLTRVQGCMFIGHWHIDWDATNGNNMPVVCDHCAIDTVCRLIMFAPLILRRSYELRVHITAKPIRRNWWNFFRSRDRMK